MTGNPAPQVTTAKPAAPERLDAGGTMWRLRSLVAMGHDATRIARALRTRPALIRGLIRGDIKTVSPDLHDLTRQLWEAWWDKLPPEHTGVQRRAASLARHRARRHHWCAPLGLDEEYLDDPGYRPYSIYRPATGTGVAADFAPHTRTQARRKRMKPRAQTPEHHRAAKGWPGQMKEEPR